MKFQHSVALLPLCALVLNLVGCPDGDDENPSTSATESSATATGSDGDPITTSPSTSTTEPEEPTTTSTTAPDSESGTPGGPVDTTTTTAGPTAGEDTRGSTTDDTTTVGTTTDGDTQCGNGEVERDEECDEGEGNADGDYGGCNLDCTKQPFCGDGETQTELGEPCDPSDEELVEAAVCTDVCTWSGVIAFVTSEAYAGDLDGADGADEKCVTLASAAGLVHPEGYRAWISVGGDTANNRIPKVSDPYYRLDGVKIAENSGELFSGKLKSPINITEVKKAIGTSKVWTNTTPSGDAAGENTDCQSFHSMDDGDTAIVGRSDETGIGWTKQALMASCIDTWRLYCFSEQF